MEILLHLVFQEFRLFPSHDGISSPFRPGVKESRARMGEDAAFQRIRLGPTASSFYPQIRIHAEVSIWGEEG